MSYGRLLICSMGLVGLGGFSLILMSRVATQQNLGGEWTGIATAYALLANTRTFGVCLAMLLFARTRRTAPLIIALIRCIDRLSFN